MGEMHWDGQRWLVWNGDAWIAADPQPPPPMQEPAPTPTTPAAVPGDAKPTSSTPGSTAIGCAGLIVLLLLGGWLLSRCGSSSTGGSDNSTGASQTSREVAAWIACQSLVDATLKAPATAGYPMVTELRTSVTASGVSFPSAWVDSENGFGAQIRTDVSCSTTGTTDDPSGYTVTRLTVGGQTVIS